MNYKNKELRGMVLKVIHKSYPDKVGDYVICEVLEDAGYNINPPELKSHLDYLEGNGYIETSIIENRDLNITRIVAKMTPQGINLMEGNIPDDPGIEVV